MDMKCGKLGRTPSVAWVRSDRAGHCNCCHDDTGGHVYEIELHTLVLRLCADCMRHVIRQVNAR